jgi:hypothetical protein
MSEGRESNFIKNTTLFVNHLATIDVNIGIWSRLYQTKRQAQPEQIKQGRKTTF